MANYRVLEQLDVEFSYYVVYVLRLGPGAHTGLASAEYRFLSLVWTREYISALRYL